MVYLLIIVIGQLLRKQTGLFVRPPTHRHPALRCAAPRRAALRWVTSRCAVATRRRITLHRAACRTTMTRAITVAS